MEIKTKYEIGQEVYVYRDFNRMNAYDWFNNTSENEIVNTINEFIKDCVVKGKIKNITFNMDTGLSYIISNDDKEILVAEDRICDSYSNMAKTIHNIIMNELEYVSQIVKEYFKNKNLKYPDEE